MTKKVLFAVGILLAVALVAVAADNITGKWTYEMQGRGGGGGGGNGGGTPRVVTLDLKVAGASLTGTVLQPAFGGRGGGGGADPAAAPPAPTATPIANGKVNGDSFSFEVSRPGRNGGDPTVTKYEGTAAGGELKLKVTAPGRGGDPTTTEVTAKKSTT
jgi:hypothetical protein